LPGGAASRPPSPPQSLDATAAGADAFLAAITRHPQVRVHPRSPG